MSRLKKLAAASPIHQRKIEVRTYPLENNQLVVEGRLTDDRLVNGFHWDGRPRPAGVVHQMVIRLLVGDWPPTILEAESEMLEIPHDLCRTVAETIQKIVGVPVSAGFSDQIKQRLGGLEGCSHLTHLILAMGPAILHGYWTQHSRKPRPVPKSLDEVQGLSILVNSCQLWKEDGPLIQLVQETIDQLNQQPK
jgi:hypothetical protein